MKFRFVFVVLIVAIGTAVFGQAKDVKNQAIPGEVDILVLAPKSTSTIPLLLAEHLDQEYDIAPGIRIHVEFFTSHAQALARLLRGDADVLLTGTSQGWQNHLDGGPVVILGTGVWGVSSMMSTVPDLHSPEDFEGLRVAFPFPGAPLDVQMRYIWEALGLDPDEDIRLSYSPPTQTVGFLLTGKIDAAPLPEPLATNLEMNRGLFRSFEIANAWADVNDGDPASPQVSLFAVHDRVETHMERYFSLLEAWRSASQLAGTHPHSFGGMFAESLGLPAEVVTEALARTMLFVPPFEENEMQVRRYFDVVKSVYPDDSPNLSPEFFIRVEPPQGPMIEEK